MALDLSPYKPVANAPNDPDKIAAAFTAIEGYANATSVTIPTSVAVGSILAGTIGYRLTTRGDLILGPNNLGASSSATFDPNQNVADFAYYASSRKLLTRSAIFREVGDGTEIQIGRAGGTYPDGPLHGSITGEGSTIYWTFYTTPVGGTPGVTTGGKWAGIPGSAAIVVRAQENVMELVGGAIAQGGEMRIQTSPLGGGVDALDRIVIRANGQVGIVGTHSGAGDLDTLNRGDLAVDGDVIAGFRTTNVKLKNPREDLHRTGRGLLSEPFNPMVGANVSVLTSQTVHVASLGLRKGDVINNLVVTVTTAAAGTAPTLIKLGLYDKNGNLLVATANIAGDAKWTSLGNKSFAVTAPYTVLADDIYYVAVLQNGAFGTTNPQILRGSNIGGGAPIGTGTLSYGEAGTGKTDLPNPATFGTSVTIVPWIGVN